MTDILEEKAGVTQSKAVENILSVFDKATPADIESGANWYGSDAQALVSDLAHLGNVSRELAAVILAHLSPRTTWARNVAGATAMLATWAETKGLTASADAALEIGCMGQNVARAAYALGESQMIHSDPLGTFSKAARKTKSFALNLLGDSDAVTVDVWAVRIALDPAWKRGGAELEKLLSRVGVYEAIADCYREAASKRGVSPQTMQATTWVVMRNGRKD